MPCLPSILRHLLVLGIQAIFIPIVFLQPQASISIKTPSANKDFLIQKMNHYINSHYLYVKDIQQFRQKDIWLSSDQFQRTGKGDCEDFSIAKYQELGFIDPRIDARLAYVRYKPKNVAHMVTVYRRNPEDRWWILDNTTDLVAAAADRQDLRPVYMFKLDSNGSVTIALLDAHWGTTATLSTVNPAFAKRVTTALTPPVRYIMEALFQPSDSRL